jgi:hypothetical protein
MTGMTIFGQLSLFTPIILCSYFWLISNIDDSKDRCAFDLTTLKIKAYQFSETSVAIYHFTSSNIIEQWHPE